MAQVDLTITTTRRNPLYGVWCNMKGRCSNKKIPCYQNYGGRGISVSPDWSEFANFYRDMIEGYEPGLQLDRIDNDGDYSRGNCRWSTRRENTRNTRRTKMITYAGLTKCVTEWAEHLGIKKSTFTQRYYVYHWSLERLIGDHLGTN